MALIKPGALIRSERTPDDGGTLGCVVQSRADPSLRYILTAAHVIGANGYAQHGDAIQAQGANGKWIKIAEYEGSVPWRDAPGIKQTCDAAIARITNPGVISPEIEGIGMPGEIATGLYQGMNLRFSGAGTGTDVQAAVHSKGKVVAITYDNDIDGGSYTLEFADQILYGIRAGNVWAPASHPMDSGALVLTQDNLAVGLHIARTPDDYAVSTSVCTPLTTVLDALGVTLVTTAAAVAGAGAGPGAVAGAGAPPALSQDPDELGKRSMDAFDVSIRALLEPHNPFGGSQWQLGADGLIVDGRLDRTAGTLVTVPRVWKEFGTEIAQSAAKYRVPVELIMATICTESSGKPGAKRIEPGWTSDQATPNKVSAGLMQTLISTARDATGNRALDRAALFDAATSIDAGTAYIDFQRSRTRLDPPQVACAYNAGGLYLNEGSANRWRMRQYPIGTGEHADRFVTWFNDCFAFFGGNPGVIPAGVPSFCKLFGKG